MDYMCDSHQSSSTIKYPTPWPNSPFKAMSLSESIPQWTPPPPKGLRVVARVAAAIISHPTDTLLSKVNKARAEVDDYCGGDEGGLLKRCVMIETLITGEYSCIKSGTMTDPRARREFVGS